MINLVYVSKGQIHREIRVGSWHVLKFDQIIWWIEMKGKNRFGNKKISIHIKKMTSNQVYIYGEINEWS